MIRKLVLKERTKFVIPHKPGILKAAYGGATWDKHLIRFLNEVLLLLDVIMKYNAMISLYLHL
jgi:hypothetical protein